MNSPRITYVPRPDANPQAELDALRNIYRFILDCKAKKEGGPTTAPNDTRGGSRNGSRANKNYT
jgi:hypothetical protein